MKRFLKYATLALFIPVLFAVCSPKAKADQDRWFYQPVNPAYVTYTGATGNIKFGNKNITSVGTISASGVVSAPSFTSSVATGAAPFTVASTTNVANLNASSLSGNTFASPPAIGNSSASPGTFTTLTYNNLITTGNTSGTFLGYAAGGTRLPEQYNTAFGNQAMYSNTSGQANNAFGASALYTNSTGNNNTAMGEGALYTTSNQSDSTAIGMFSLYSANANANTAIGSYALYDITSGYWNVGIGRSAGHDGTNVTTEYGNTLIGYKAGMSASVNNSTCIGYTCKVATSNTVQLGNTSVTLVNTSGALTVGMGGSANHAICWKPDGKTLGYCSAVVASDGTCGTCN